jgi:hypothetical protein
MTTHSDQAEGSTLEVQTAAGALGPAAAMCEGHARLFEAAAKDRIELRKSPTSQLATDPSDGS